MADILHHWYNIEHPDSPATILTILLGLIVGTVTTLISFMWTGTLRKMLNSYFHARNRQRLLKQIEQERQNLFT